MNHMADYYPTYNSKVICYMDDILVYSCTLSDHQWIIHQVLSTLQEWRLFLKPEKCRFEQKEVEYLGLVISKDHVTMDLTKVHGVTEWLTPMKVKEVQPFLGFVNFYQKFIHDFSDITCPLYALTCKTQQWVWGSPEQEVFNALKKAVVGRIMVLGVTHLYKPVLALRTSQSLQVRSPTTGMLF